jgi:hypothetical protein
MPETTLAYATPASQPTQHSAAAGWSWAALIFEAAYRGSIVAYLYHRAPKPEFLDDEHFSRNLANRAIFVSIDASILLIGAGLGLAACMPEHRKRWAAALALAANLVALVFALDPFPILDRLFLR